VLNILGLGLGKAATEIARIVVVFNFLTIVFCQVFGLCNLVLGECSSVLQKHLIGWIMLNIFDETLSFIK
jgi:hypothetical protein